MANSNTPIFGAGNYEIILKAISNNTISYPAWMFCRDKQMLGFVESDGSFVLMKGDNKEQVVYVDTLPDVSEGDTSVLYIVDTICYKFDGEAFVALGQDYTDELDTLDAKIIAISEKITGLETADSTFAEQIDALEEKINAIEISKECKCAPNNRYEIVKTPDGTLIDYFDKEIRVMIPSTTDFATVDNGISGAENMFYIESHIYIPEGAVRYSLNFGGTVLEGAVEDFSGCTDEYGRIYIAGSPPVAYYDTESATWVYYGANSTTEHYIGWDQIVDWYDENGIMIASDSIRINLSNEDCHFALEPFYITKMTSEISALKEAVEDLGTNSGSTFIELE